MVVPESLMAPLAPGTPPLLATQRLPALSKTIPRGPLKAAELMTTVGISGLVPVMASWAAVYTWMVLLLWSLTHWLPAPSKTDCCGKAREAEVMMAAGSGFGVLPKACT